MSSELEVAFENACLTSAWRKLNWAARQIEGAGKKVLGIGLRGSAPATELFVEYVDRGRERVESWSIWRDPNFGIPPLDQPEAVENQAEIFGMLVWTFVNDPKS